MDRVLHQGWSVAAAAEALQVSRQTGYRWLRRYRTEGPAGLLDRPPIARRRPHALPRASASCGRAGSTAGGRTAWPGTWACPAPRSTACCGDIGSRGWRTWTGPRSGPCATPASSQLLHLDVKKLGRIPPGGGHRIWGRSQGRRRGRRGYDFLHVAIDDCSRVAFVQAYPDERGPTTARSWPRLSAFFATPACGSRPS